MRLSIRLPAHTPTDARQILIRLSRQSVQHPSVHLFIHPFIHPYVRPPTYPSVRLPTYPPRPSVYPPTPPSVYPPTTSVRPSTHLPPPSVHPPTPSVRLPNRWMAARSSTDPFVHPPIYQNIPRSKHPLNHHQSHLSNHHIPSYLAA